MEHVICLTKFGSVAWRRLFSSSFSSFSIGCWWWVSRKSFRLSLARQFIASHEIRAICVFRDTADLPWAQNLPERFIPCEDGCPLNQLCFLIWAWLRMTHWAVSVPGETTFPPSGTDFWKGAYSCPLPPWQALRGFNSSPKSLHSFGKNYSWLSQHFYELLVVNLHPHCHQKRKKRRQNPSPRYLWTWHLEIGSL